MIRKKVDLNVAKSLYRRGWSFKEIGEYFGVGEPWVRQLIRNEMQLRHVEKICVKCRKRETIPRSDYCQECQYAALKFCVDCGVGLRHRISVRCRRCRGVNSRKVDDGLVVWLYVKIGVSAVQIAEVLGVSYVGVYYSLDRSSIPRRPGGTQYRKFTLEELKCYVEEYQAASLKV